MRILTDSTADFSLEEAKKLNIDVIPLSVIIDGKEFKDRVDLQPSEFFEKLAECEDLPSTSQPSPKDYFDYIKKAKQNNEPLIMILLSSQISGTYQSACMAKELAEYEDVYVIDSLNTTVGLRLLVDKAIQLRDERKDAKEIVDILEQMKNKIRLFAVVDTLEYFYKGGRLSRASAVAGTLLKLKPIVGLKDGKLDVYAKARGISKATKEILPFIEENPIDTNEGIYYGYTGNMDQMDKFAAVFEEAFFIKDVPVTAVGPVIGTHAGPGARVIAYFSK